MQHVIKANAIDGMSLKTDLTVGCEFTKWWGGSHENAGDFYSPSIHVTAQGGIGINVGGTVHVRTISAWHSLGAGDPFDVMAKEIKAQSERTLKWERLHDARTKQVETLQEELRKRMAWNLTKQVEALLAERAEWNEMFSINRPEGSPPLTPKEARLLKAICT